MFCEILACVVGCMMEGNFPSGSAGSATSFSEKACSYLESKSKVWPDGYSQVRPFDDAIKLARQVSLVGRDASTKKWGVQDRILILADTSTTVKPITVYLE